MQVIITLKLAGMTVIVLITMTNAKGFTVVGEFASQGAVQVSRSIYDVTEQEHYISSIVH